ncbi:MAG: hypothetical protein J6M31_02575 [Bacteroidales bacterium]|nr:hypothetical protein [Bacteroidales bacterium]
MENNLKVNCYNAIMQIIQIGAHVFHQDLSVDSIRFVKCYEIVASQMLKQFDSYQEYTQFKKNDTLSFDEMVQEIQSLINNNYRVSWIDFTLYYVTIDTVYTLLHVITDDCAVEPQYHVGIIRTLSDDSNINAYVDNMEMRLMNKRKD